VRVAVIQFKPRKGDPAAAWTGLARLVTAAGEAGSRLIVCPEMAQSGYLFPDHSAALQIAEEAAGEGLACLGELARRYGAWLVSGYAELGTRDAAGLPRLYNSARVIGPEGQLVYNYRKRLLYDSDTTWALAGDTPYPLLDTPAGRLSVGICMDLNDDRFTAFLRQSGPRVVAFCTNWLDEGIDVLPYWRYRLAGTACYFLAANTYGSEEAPGHPSVRFCGRSAILGPGRRLLGRAPAEGDAVVLAELPDLTR